MAQAFRCLEDDPRRLSIRIIVTDRRNGATEDRRNGATDKWLKRGLGRVKDQAFLGVLASGVFGVISPRGFESSGSGRGVR